MSDIWTNFSSEKLIKLIGEDQLADIETHQIHQQILLSPLSKYNSECDYKTDSR